MNLLIVFLFFIVDLCNLICLPIMFLLCLLVSIFTVWRGKGFCVNSRLMIGYLVNVETFSEKIAHFPSVFVIITGTVYLLEYIVGWSDILVSRNFTSVFFWIMILSISLFFCSLMYSILYYYREFRDKDEMKESLLGLSRPPDLVLDLSSDSHDSEIEELLEENCCNYYCCSLKGTYKSFCPLFYLLGQFFIGCGNFCNCLDQIFSSECCCFFCLCCGSMYYNFGNLG